MNEQQKLILAEARALIYRAEAAGMVLTIEQQPLEPLAMGSYVTVPSVRAARGARNLQPVHPVAYEFHNINGHAIVDYSDHTHAGHLTAEKGYRKRALIYADPVMPSHPEAAPAALAGFSCAAGAANAGRCENWCGKCVATIAKV